MILALIIVAAFLIIWLGLPPLLRSLGLHPAYSGEEFDLIGKRALFVTTSQDRLKPKNKRTGVFPSELTVPYYEFKDSGMEVELASIKGGKIPIEEYGMRWPIGTKADRRAKKDQEFQRQLNDSKKVDDIDPKKYDLIFLPGGWGAAYDLGFSKVLGEKLSEAWANGAVIGAVCHGPLGLLNVKEANGEPLLMNRNVTAVSNKQVKELSIGDTPHHPERELRNAGAIYKSNTAFKDVLANLTVVDGRLVTGQNQNAGKETSQEMMKILAVSG